MDLQSLGKSHESGKQGIIKSWLSSWDFIDDPFGYWEAGREPLLEQYFVRRPFYEQLLESPRSMLVFAPRGGGKSATRIMIASECRPAVPNSKVLAVPFTDFSPFAETHAAHGRYSLEDYLPFLISSALRQLIIAACDLPIWGGDFMAKDIGELRYWLEQYAPQYLSKDFVSVVLSAIAPDTIPERKSAWVEAISGEGRRSSLSRVSPKIEAYSTLWKKLKEARSSSPSLISSSPSGVMVEFLAFACRFLSSGTTSCHSVYFLVDGIDEYDLTQNDPDAAAEILRPLLGNLHFLELPGLAIKCFLPLEHKESFERTARTDRLETYFLSWETNAPEKEFEGLRDMMHRRIETFNKANIRSITEMCMPALSPWIEEAVLDESAGSPRNLLRLGHQIFVEHCRNLPDPESMIEMQDWERALRWYRVNLAQVHAEEKTHSVSSPLIRANDEKLVLKVDPRAGKIYHGSKQLQHHLGDLEFGLLVYLYRRKGQVCSREELLDAVYGEGAMASPQMLGTLIYRLRQKIEPPGQSEYFIQTVRGRGYRLENAI
jgi:hypothetical protein